jgi:hypothetical protein
MASQGVGAAKGKVLDVARKAHWESKTKASFQLSEEKVDVAVKAAHDAVVAARRSAYDANQFATAAREAAEAANRSAGNAREAAEATERIVRPIS